MSKLTVKQYANIHKITPQAVYSRVNRGDLQVEEIDGVKYIIIDDTPDFEKMFNELKRENEWIKRENEWLKERVNELKEQLQMNKESFEIWRRVLPPAAASAPTPEAPAEQPEEIIEAEPEPERSAAAILADLATLSKKEKKMAIEALPKKQRRALMILLKRK